MVQNLGSEGLVVWSEGFCKIDSVKNLRGLDWSMCLAL